MASLQRLDRCRDPSRFSAWLLTSVRNRALNRIEMARVRADHAAGATEAEGEAGPGEQVLLRRRLLAALERLTSVQREVVLLHDLEGWTHAEIAAALELSEVMSRQHLFVARRKMREDLARDAREEDR